MVEQSMPQDLVAPERFSNYVPGQPTRELQSTKSAGVSVTGYTYEPSIVWAPPVRDHLIVCYRNASTTIRRHIDGESTSAFLRPGDVSLLTRGVASHWEWQDNVDVVHVWLSEELLGSVCAEMYHRNISKLELRDELNAGDPLLYRTAMLLATEINEPDLGDRLLVDALTCQLAVYVLRRHANITFDETSAKEGLSDRQAQLIREFIDQHLGDKPNLRELAAVVNMSPYHFARQFRQSVGTSPHEFVTARRLARTQWLLANTKLSLAEVAMDCGFVDQSHMSRLFRARLDMTPGQYRLASKS